MSVSLGVGVSRTPSDGVSIGDGVGGGGVEGVDGPIPLLHMPLESDLSLTRGTGPVTFTRASDGTFVNPSTAFVDTASTNVARFEANGFLCEGANTNEALHGRDVTNAVWVKTNITPVKDATGADGVVNTASTLTATAANGTAFQTVTKASAENTFSIDVRRKTGTGTIEITDDGGSTFTDITASINSSTYTRFEITTTQANPSFGVRIVTSGDEVEVDYAGLEVHPFATSRIETAGSTVTRATDVLSVPPSNIPSPTSDYSVSVEVDVLGKIGGGVNQDLYTVPGESFRILRAVTNGTIIRVFHNTQFSPGTLSDNTTTKLTVTKDSSLVIAYIDGVDSGDLAPGTVGGTATSITIGSDGTTPLYGHLKNFKTFGVTLTPTQVAA